ncbi:MAG TPA: FGGY-family carbohydrate kinase, partial [Feifaniaceae bacterium]|nr:FGGY-family carbohydrate kinase [Feifaniaceae bacterium]
MIANRKREPAFLAIDAGTGDCRAIAFSGEGRVLAFACTEWTYERSVPGREDFREFAPDACFQSICSLIRSVSASLDNCEVKAVSVTSQRDGMAFLDANGRELYCAPNMDLRGKAVLPELEPHAEEILRSTGLPLHAMFGLPRLLWQKRFAPEQYERIDCALMLCDWIAYRLCGEKRSERSAAGSSQMFSLARNVYDDALLERLELKTGIFPNSCFGDEPIGMLPAAIAAETGLPQGVPVFTGGSDTHCALVGMGLLRAGVTAVVAGTTTPVLAICDRPLIDPAGGAFSNPGTLNNQWTLECNAGSTGLSLRWIRELFCPEREDAFAFIDREAEKVAPGCDGMHAYIGITLSGEPARANLGGFLFPVPWNIGDFTRAHFFRAALETNAFAVCANLESLRALGAKAPDVLHVCGGQSKSAPFLQMLADTSGIAVQTYEHAECTALGAALLAAKGAGHFASLEEAAGAFVRAKERVIPQEHGMRVYREIYTKWRELRA